MKKKSILAFVTAFSMIASFLGLWPVLPAGIALATGTTYYVSPTGSAANTGLTTGSPWTLTKAAATVTAGDTVLFMDGVYTEQLVPLNSGTAGNPITYKALNPRQATLTYTVTTNPMDNHMVIKIKGKSYLTISGFKVKGNLNYGKWLLLDSSDGTATGTKNTNITISDNAFSYATGGWGPRAPFAVNYTEQLKLLNNTMTEAYDGDDLISFANSSKLLIQGNDFSKARHTVVVFGYAGAYNSVNDVVVRSNVFNSQWSRNFEVFPNSRYLFEGNVFAEQRYGSGNASSRDSIHADRLIFRNNRFIRNYSGGTLSSAPYNDGSTDLYFTNSAFYNNVFAENEVFAFLFGGNGVYRIKNDFFKNNIFYNNDQNASNRNLRYFERKVNPDGTQTFAFIDNNFWNGAGKPPYILGTNNNFVFSDNDYKLWTLAEVETMSDAAGSQVPQFDDNTNVNPLFADPGNYDFTLQSGSPMIDGGTNLTTASAAGTASTALNVVNPNYFFDGWGIGGETGDVISVGSATNRARITNIAYSTDPTTGVVTGGTLTLDTPLTWSSGASVSIAYAGSAPDLGIVETGATAPASLQVTTGTFKSTAGTSIAFDAGVFGSFTPVSYAWRFGDGSTGTGATPSHAYSQPGQYTVYATATDAAGKTVSGVTYVIVNAADYLSQPMVYHSFDADDRLYAQVFRYSERGNEVPSVTRQFDGTNGVIHVPYNSANTETKQLRYAYYPTDWNINQFPIVSAKYKVNPGTPLLLALEAYPVGRDQQDNQMYPIAATASANEPTAAYTLIDDGEWHTIEVDARDIRDLGGIYANLNYLRSAGFRIKSAGSAGMEYWVDDFSIKPDVTP
ncbi:PKD domain-containing protein [Cohnella hashimotonis]|uniref:PKD domain-containing protein n=1 Tax=Cohnella hashimotonis TaxID=2826895 RepID=A0ABT6TSI7_9BACL|nr:PKD domain-containing protein [Cohnella hashimotonis]